MAASGTIFPQEAPASFCGKRLPMPTAAVLISARIDRSRHHNKRNRGVHVRLHEYQSRHALRIVGGGVDLSMTGLTASGLASIEGSKAMHVGQLNLPSCPRHYVRY